MATSPLRLQQGYGIGNALQPIPPFSIIANRAPTQQDKARIGTFWVYTALNNVYVLTSVTGGVSNWLTLSNGGAGVFLSLTVNGPSTFNGNVTQIAGVTSLLATTTAGLTNNGNFTNNTGAVTINPPATPATSSLTVIGQNTAAQASLNIQATVNGLHNAIQAYNLDNVNAGSCEIAVVTSSQDGTGGKIGDSQVRFTTAGPIAPGTVEFTIGKDASANQFVISEGSNLGISNRLTIAATTGDVAISNGNLQISASGKTLGIKQGANAMAGTIVLDGVTGSFTQANTQVDANSIILLSRVNVNGASGAALTYTINPNTSFTVTARDATTGLAVNTDASTIAYMIVQLVP